MTSICLVSSVPFVKANIQIQDTVRDSLPDIVEISLKTAFSAPRNDAKLHGKLNKEKVWAFVDLDLFKNSQSGAKHEYRLYLGQGMACVIDRKSGEEDKIYAIEHGKKLSLGLYVIHMAPRVRVASKLGICVGVIGLVGVLFHQMKLAHASGMASLLKVSNWKGGVGVVGFGLVAAISRYVLLNLPSLKQKVERAFVQGVVGVAIQMHKKCTENVQAPITLRSHVFTYY